jgi:hypothetical protein
MGTDLFFDSGDSDSASYWKNKSVPSFPSPYFSHLASQPSTSPYQCFEFCPFRTQWFSSG